MKVGKPLFVIHINVFNKIAWTVSFSFLYPSIKFKAYHGPGSQYVSDKELRPTLLLGRLDGILYCWSHHETHGPLLCMSSNVALSSYPQVSSETLWS